MKVTRQIAMKVVKYGLPSSRHAYGQPRPSGKPQSGRIVVNVINHLGDEVMKVFRV